ncbi:MAG: YegP family protein [Anaerolineales bacterium]
MAKFEIYKDKKGQFRWRLLANNNQVIATGEGYTSKAACKNGIKSVQQNAPKAEIDDQS